MATFSSSFRVFSRQSTRLLRSSFFKRCCVSRLQQPCRVPPITSYCMHYEISSTSYSTHTTYWTLHNLVSQGQYEKAVDLFEHEVSSSSGQIDPSLYNVIMAICEKLGSADAAMAVKKDMDEQRVSMDEKCSIHYLNALLSGRCADEALRFVQRDGVHHTTTFLAKAAECFNAHGFPHHAFTICDLEGPGDPILHGLQLEILGSLKNTSKMRELIDQHYGGDLNSAPISIQVSFTNGLAMADKHKDAIDILTTLPTGTPIASKSVALLLESCQRAKDWKTGVMVFHQFWKKAFSHPQSALPTKKDKNLSKQSTYLLRAINSAIFLQALILSKSVKQSLKFSSGKNIFSTRGGWAKMISMSAWQQEITENVKIKGGKEVQKFLLQQFYLLLRAESLLPDKDTYQALLLLSCYSEVGPTIADRAIKLYISSGGKATPEFFTSWTDHCGPLFPNHANRVIRLAVLHSDGYNLPLSSQDYQCFLDVTLKTGHNNMRLEKEAADCIRFIKASMRKRGLLNTIDQWNQILSALSRTGNIGALITTYNEMQEQRNIEPDLRTFHIMVDGNLREGGRRNSKGAAYTVWRNLVKEYPRVKPDIELMNKLIRCCRICREYDRAFYFLSVLKDHALVADLDTFRELLQICAEMEDRDKFQTVVNLARRCLPDQRANITTIVKKYEQEWLTEKDIELAETIIGQIGRR